jgi:glutathione S-transferase
VTALRLHGYPVSNYFNIARAALIEKALPHEIVLARATQDEAFLAMNPMGKVPVLETPGGWIAETVAILEFLEDHSGDVPLRPHDITARARGRQIVNVVQMYVEAPARMLFPGVFATATNSAETLAGVRVTLDRAAAALAWLVQPAPFLLGEMLSAADLFAFYNLDIVDRVTRFVYDRSILDEIGLRDWHVRIGDRASSHVVLSDFERCFADYLVDKGGPYRASAVTSGRHDDA